MMTSDDARIVSEILTAMLREGRCAEVDEILVQSMVWEQDDRALGPDLARLMLEVDRMQGGERAMQNGGPIQFCPNGPSLTRV